MNVKKWVKSVQPVGYDGARTPHWTYCLYFHSNYCTHSLYHFEKPAIVATKRYIFIFMHVKPIEVTSGFNLRVMKKSARWLCHTEKSKTNIKKLISPLLTRTQGSQGCQKMRKDPLFNFVNFLKFVSFLGNLSALCGCRGQGHKFGALYLR